MIGCYGLAHSFLDCERSRYAEVWWWKAGAFNKHCSNSGTEPCGFNSTFQFVAHTRKMQGGSGIGSLIHCCAHTCVPQDSLESIGYLLLPRPGGNREQHVQQICKYTATTKDASVSTQETNKTTWSSSRSVWINIQTQSSRQSKMSAAGALEWWMLVTSDCIYLASFITVRLQRVIVNSQQGIGANILCVGGCGYGQAATGTNRCQWNRIWKPSCGKSSGQAICSLELGL